MKLLRGLIWLWLCASLLVSCGGSKAPSVENAYENRVKDFTHMGVKAMSEERWQPAVLAFSRALQMAQLLGDVSLEVRSWYNLGMAYRGLKAESKADGAFKRAFDLADQHQLTVSRQRAHIQLALLHRHEPDHAWQLPAWDKSWPMDLKLSWASCAREQGDMSGAKQGYLDVVAAKVANGSGYVMQGQAMMGLAWLVKQQGDELDSARWAEKAGMMYRKVGAPRMSAHALLFLSDNRSRTVMQRIDAARRAKVIYEILQDKEGAMKAAHLLNALELSEGVKRE